MTINVPEQVGAVLAELAAKLGVAAESLWGVVLRQQTITGWLLVMAAIVALVIVCFSIIGFAHNTKGMAEDGDYSPAANFYMTTAIVCFAGFGGFACFGMRLVLNPAFYALNYILGLLR